MSAIPSDRVSQNALRGALVSLAVLFAGCSGSDGNPGSTTPGTGGNFVVLRTTPPNNGTLFLNESIQIDFSNPVDLDSADLNTVSFEVTDLNGVPLAESPSGTFEVATSPGDSEPGRRLLFTPRFPENDTFSDGGFRSGRRYTVQLVAGTSGNGTTLVDMNGRGLQAPSTFTFETATGTTPNDLFRDTIAGGPRAISLTVTPNEPGGIPLSRSALDPVEVRIQFDQPLNPSSVNIPEEITEDPVTRGSNFGRVFLEYDDPDFGPPQVIPAVVSLETNSRTGSLLVLRPIGVLPNNANVRVIVERTLEDLSGESNVSDPTFNRIAGTFQTATDFEPQFDALVSTFGMGNEIDESSAFLEPQARLDGGRLSATFDFSGTENLLEYRPNTTEVVLNTDFTQISPVGTPPINVPGGVFQFREVTIPEGVTVRGEGTNPMVWLVNGDFTVNGTLTVRGGDGDRVDTLNSANFPTAAGSGVAGGGAGGAGSPMSNDRSLKGEDGFGPFNATSGGGEGGDTATIACGRGAGGGGGGFTTEGDPTYPPATVVPWPQVLGDGGPGCNGLNGATTRVLAGGNPGPLAFTDNDDGNDFFGSGVDLNVGVRVEGELLQLRGGSGGGGGGDLAPSLTTGGSFITDEKGGGGGGGGGIIVVQALGRITVGPNGQIVADGGNGGGGEQAGGNNRGGGGAAGSGGMIVLISAEGIDLSIREFPTDTDEIYLQSDFFFSLSADGGIGTQGDFTTEIFAKYGPTRRSVGNGSWNDQPAGAFGGMGLIQLLTPPGDDADGTGNSLDDNIRFLETVDGSSSVVTNAARKIGLLGWRGYPGPMGTRVDENGMEVRLPNSADFPGIPAGRSNVPVGDNTGWGDVRPSPVLLPAPFGPTSRARSRWIDVGFNGRVPVTTEPPVGEARRVVIPMGEESIVFGDPDNGFSSTSLDPSFEGYGVFEASTGEFAPPVVDFGGTEDFGIAAINTEAMFEGTPATSITLAGITLPGENRFTGYRLEVDAGGPSLGDFFILGHGTDTVFVRVEGTFPTTATTARIVAQFFGVSVDGTPGLGSTFPASGQLTSPQSNIRVGFAFTTDPLSTDPMDRWPSTTNVSDFEFDLTDPMFRQWVTDNRPQFVRYDVLFNTQFDPTRPSEGNVRPGGLVSSGGDIELPSLEYIVLPYRF
ncbi:MAG: Ig-like domain-containing protein [Planctomycetota bacterium]